MLLTSNWIVIEELNSFPIDLHFNCSRFQFYISFFLNLFSAYLSYNLRFPLDADEDDQSGKIRMFVEFFHYIEFFVCTQLAIYLMTKSTTLYSYAFMIQSDASSQRVDGRPWLMGLCGGYSIGRSLRLRWWINRGGNRAVNLSQYPK